MAAEASGNRENEECPHGEDDSAASASKSDNAEKAAPSQAETVRRDMKRHTVSPMRNSTGRQRRNHTQKQSKRLTQRRSGNRSVSRAGNMRKLERNNLAPGHRTRRQFTRKRGRSPIPRNKRIKIQKEYRESKAERAPRDSERKHSVPRSRPSSGASSSSKSKIFYSQEFLSKPASEIWPEATRDVEKGKRKKVTNPVEPVVDILKDRPTRVLTLDLLKQRKKHGTTNQTRKSDESGTQPDENT